MFQASCHKARLLGNIDCTSLMKRFLFLSFSFSFFFGILFIYPDHCSKSLISIIEALPNELLLEILCFLKARDLISLRLTCRCTKDLSFEPRLWQLLCASLNEEPHLRIRSAAQVMTSRFGREWEWVYKSKRLSFIKLTNKGATCYSRSPPVLPHCWVACHEDINCGWTYQGKAAFVLHTGGEQAEMCK